MFKYFILIFFFITATGYSQSNVSEQQLITLTKVYGLIKYYNNTKDDSYLDKELLKLISDLIKKETGDENFNSSILQLIGGNETISSTAYNFENIFDRFSGTDHLIVVNFSWIEQSSIITDNNKELLKQLVSTHEKIRNSNIDHKQIYIHDEQIGIESISKKEGYILGLIKFWNVINYFFPYKNLMDSNWENVLHHEISEFYKVDSYESYDLLLKKLSSYLKDSHVDVEDKSRDDYNVWKLPFSVVIVENQMVVKSVNDSLSKLYNIRTGDIIESIGGENYNELWHDFSNVVSYSTPQAGRQDFVVYLWHKFNYYDTSVIATFNSDDLIHQESIKTIKLEDYRKFKPWIESVGGYKSISKKIGYINYDNLGYANLGKAIRSLKDKDYLILDCRGYNSSLANLRLLNFIGNTQIPFAKSYQPNLDFPGVFYRPKSIKVNLPSSTKAYRGKFIVLINEKAISAMESVLMAIETRRKEAVFIGSPTQGADGEQNMVILPDNIKILYSGNNWQYPDGSQFQRIGVQPDIHIEETIENLKENKDTVLNYAIEYIKSLELKQTMPKNIR